MLDTRDTPFDAPLRALRVAGSCGLAAAPHRAIRRIAPGALRLAGAVAITASTWFALAACRAPLRAFWDACIGFWLPLLGLTSEQAAASARLPPYARLPLPWPAPGTVLAAIGLSLLGWYLAGRLRNEKTPLKYLVRILCAILLATACEFRFFPGGFRYGLGDHLSELLDNGYRLMLAVPFMLGVGYYLFHERLLVKLRTTAAILAYFTLMIPHKAVLHIALLEHGTALLMPLLYLCLGMAFDVLVFVALYAYAMSNLAEQRYG